MSLKKQDYLDIQYELEIRIQLQQQIIMFEVYWKLADSYWYCVCGEQGELKYKVLFFLEKITI